MFEKFNFNKQIALRILLFIAMAVVIAIFMPRPDRVKYNYEVGKPWEYPNLLSKFQFEVGYEDSEIASMRDSIARVTPPIFSKNDTVEKNLNNFVKKNFNNKIRKDSTYLNAWNLHPDQASPIDVVTKLIGECYEVGVADNALVSKMRENGIKNYQIFKDKVYESSDNVSSVRNTDEAYNQLYNAIVVDHNKNKEANIKAVYKRVWQILDTAGIRSWINPNLIYNEEETNKVIDSELAKRVNKIEMVQEGELIISRGAPVTPAVYKKIKAYERELEERENATGSSSTFIGIGQIIFASAMMAIFGLCLYNYRRKVFDNWRQLLCVTMLVLVFFLFGLFMQTYISSGLYIVPFAIIPIIIVVFFDIWLAIFALLMAVLICAPYSDFPLEFIIVEIVAGMTAIFSTRVLSKRSQLMQTSALVCGAYIVSYCALQMMLEGTTLSISWKLIGFFGANMILTSFAYVLIFVIEKLFGFTSIVTLVELSDINNPVLRELSVECPGTFQHSLAVSNLVSAAAQEVDANVQLVRTGALYHDIGKLKNPAFFTENQHGTNPHDALTPIQSARIIIGHITDGLARAEKEKLPKVIRDMIVQHHGRSVARYFYNTYCNQHLGEEVDPAPFTYPGPNPQSKEASLLMMADVVEAASRSLPDHSPERIEGLVNKLIDAQVAEGLHSESPLSFRDITIIKRSFIKSLKTMYHVRIAYPERKKAEAGKDAVTGN